jgi:RNA polymerase sigma factor (sigma-70 family)
LVAGLYKGVESGSVVSADPWSADAFDDWVRPHVGVMRGLAARLTSAAEADDIVQEALTSAWRLTERFDERKGSARTWLLTLTADQVRQHRRRTRRVPTPVGTSPDEGAFDVQADVDLRAAIRKLTQRQQLAVAAYYYLDLAVDDVAAVMACSPGTVKSTLAAARERLHLLLKEDIHNEH